MADVERELSRIDDHLVFFLDDNLLANRRHARALFDVLRGSGIVWQAAASLDVARDPRYLEEAYEAGCRSLFVGFESLSPENMRGNNKLVNAATDYAEACRRFHDAGIMINGSFVFGFDCDGPDVFDRTVEFTDREQDPHGVVSHAHAAARHAGVRPPGGRRPASAPQLDLLRHVSRGLPAAADDARATGGGLQAGAARVRDLELDLPPLVGPARRLKRIAYNVAWRVDPLWVAIIRAGLMPFATRIFERVLRLSTAAEGLNTEEAIGSTGR